MLGNSNDSQSVYFVIKTSQQLYLMMLYMYLNTDLVNQMKTIYAVSGQEQCHNLYSYCLSQNMVKTRKLIV